ncbi:MAG TPA: class I SAM-dependent methyltransferase [Desulfobacteria bacterium]|nr:class I SAM-dependent methyltransferase [Desulfobacteria bacterium]
MTTSELIRKRYNRTSLFYDCMDRMIKDDVRRRIIELAHGRVLEAGVGTGNNLRFYRPDCRVTGVDFSSGMLKKAREKAKGLPNVELYEMDVQNLEFDDNTFDTIVSTCVFCSVPDPVKGLKELRRVCKPDGQLIFLEHVRSSNKLMGLMMDFFNPVVVRLIGANINRPTLENIEKAGIKLKDVEIVNMEIVKLVIAVPDK